MSDTPGDSDAKNAVAYFDEIARRYAIDAAHRPSFAERFNTFASLFESYQEGSWAGARAIDLGCGSGVIAHQLAGLGLRPIGIDGSARMLQAAARTVGPNADIEFRHEQLPLPEAMVGELAGTVKVLIASSVIEYIADDESFMSQCAQILEPGGIAFISFANRASLYRWGERAAGRVSFTRGVSAQQRRQHSVIEARRLAERHGFEVVSVRFYTLPAHRYLARWVKGRPPWLATLFVLVLRAPGRVTPTF